MCLEHAALHYEFWPYKNEFVRPKGGEMGENGDYLNKKQRYIPGFQPELV